MSKILDDINSSSIYQNFINIQMVKTFNYIKTEILYLKNSQILKIARYSDKNLLNNLLLDE